MMDINHVYYIYRDFKKEYESYLSYSPGYSISPKEFGQSVDFKKINIRKRKRAKSSGFHTAKHFK